MTMRKCPTCETRPEVVKFWHDKDNRAFNHLPYVIQCICGPIARGSSKREVVHLFNDYVDCLPVAVPEPVTRWERFFAWLGM